MQKTKQIFIVGSSRSGTTMMSRILSNHHKVFTFHELHFFSILYKDTKKRLLSRDEQVSLFAKFLCIQSEGIFLRNNYKKYTLKEDISNVSAWRIANMQLKNMSS